MILKWGKIKNKSWPNKVVRYGREVFKEKSTSLRKRVSQTETLDAVTFRVSI